MTIYVGNGSWAGNMCAQSMAKQYWPDYKVLIASPEHINNLNND